MKNVIKGIITTIFSIVIFTICSYFIYKGNIKFYGEGGIGYLVGILLLFSSDKIVTDIKEVIISIFSKSKSE